MDQFQENIRTVPLLEEWSQYITGQFQVIQDILTQRTTHNALLDFNAVSQVAEKIVKETSCMCRRFVDEKKKHLNEMQYSHNCINVEKPYSNPEAPATTAETSTIPTIVVTSEEDEQGKRKRKRSIKKRKKEVETEEDLLTKLLSMQP